MNFSNNKKNLITANWWKYFIPSLLISIFLVCGTTSLALFLPDFWFKKNPLSEGASWFQYVNAYTIHNKDNLLYLKVFGWIHWSLFLLTIIVATATAWIGILQLFCYLGERKWHIKYIDSHTKIINSCKGMNINARVAMVTPTCNDFSPNTLLQTAKQTYKNFDVWICNDSNNPETIKMLNNFASEHGFHILHRSTEHKKMHPSKVGNLMYFVEKMGDKYDFVLENDSSSLITSTFVENALCYYYSPLLDTKHTGGVCCWGSFYGTKALLPYILSGSTTYADSFGLETGLCYRFNGSHILLNGWGSLYKVDALKNIDLRRVECPSDDLARGLYMCLKGFKNYVEPFDFSSKFGPQNIQAFKVQRLKWNGGDVFIARSKLAFRKFPNKFVTLFTWMQFISIIVFIPASFLLGLINVIIACTINLFYFNLSSVLIACCYGMVFAMAFIVVLLKNKASLKPLLCMIVYGLSEMGIIYKRAWQIVYKGFIRHSWSSAAVTVKTVQRSTTKQKFRMCLWDFCILIIGIAICLVLTFIPRMYFNYQLNYFVIWLNVFFFLVGPSVMYLLWVWIAEIPVKIGWDNSSADYHFWLNDFRFKYVKNCEIWKKQHANK